MPGSVHRLIAHGRTPLLVGLVLAGCSAVSSTDAPTYAPSDAGATGWDTQLPTDAAAEDALGSDVGGEVGGMDARVAGPLLELGEGATSFRPITDGDTLLLARGCQDSQHVWITLRVYDLVSGPITIHLELVRGSDGAVISVDYFVRAGFTPDPLGFQERSSIALQVPMPDPDLGADLILRGTVEDAARTMAGAERQVHITWGTEVCGL